MTDHALSIFVPAVLVGSLVLSIALVFVLELLDRIGGVE